MTTNSNKTIVKFQKCERCKGIYTLGACLLILVTLLYVETTFASIEPEIEPENLPHVGDFKRLDQDISSIEKSQSDDETHSLHITLGSKAESAPPIVESQICESDFCGKEGENFTFPVRCSGTDPNMIVTCIMTSSPQSAEFISSIGNPAIGSFYFFPKKEGFYNASFQTKALYCPNYLTDCFDNQIKTAQMQIKPDCGNIQYELYNGDIDLLSFPRLGSVLKGLSAVESWYTATYKDMFPDKGNSNIFWAYTKSDPPELKGQLSKHNTIGCDSRLIIDVNIVFPGNPQALLNPAEIREWYRFTLALANHEIGHVKIIQEGYYGNYDGKWGHKGGFNGIMQEVIGLTPERALEEIAVRENQTQQAHEKYDEDSLHGTTTDPNYSPFGPAKLNYPVK